MAARQWALQWARLARQEAELGVDADGIKEAAQAPPAARSREPGGPAGSLQNIRTQLTRQLAALEALQAAGAKGQVPLAALDRRRQTHAAALAQLATMCAAQLQELQQLEVQLGEEYEAAAASVQQVLAQPRGAGRAGSSSGDATPVPAPAPAPAAPKRGALAASSSSSSSLPAEVTAHDTFLQRHGPTGGWHPDDHTEFERILKACHGNYEYACRLCSEQLSLLHSAGDIAQHARWHEELQRLALAKRLAVQRWRLARRAEQAALMEAAEVGTAQQARQEQAASGAAAASRLQVEEQRAAVAEWRAARERARLEALQQQAAEEQERRQRDAEARMRRQQENRQLLEQRRVEKEREAAVEQGQKQCQSLGRPGSGGGACSAWSDEAEAQQEARQRLRDRNQQLLERRAAAVERRGLQAAEHAQRVEQLARRASEQFGAVERDPGRLLQATSATALRQLAALSEERAPRDSGFIRHLPRRGTPTWCAGARLQ